MLPSLLLCSAYSEFFVMMVPASLTIVYFQTIIFMTSNQKAKNHYFFNILKMGYREKIGKITEADPKYPKYFKY